MSTTIIQPFNLSTTPSVPINLYTIPSVIPCLTNYPSTGQIFHWEWLPKSGQQHPTTHQLPNLPTQSPTNDLPYQSTMQQSTTKQPFPIQTNHPKRNHPAIHQPLTLSKNHPSPNQPPHSPFVSLTN